MRSLLIVNDYFQGKNNAVFGVFLQRLSSFGAAENYDETQRTQIQLHSRVASAEFRA